MKKIIKRYDIIIIVFLFFITIPAEYYEVFSFLEDQTLTIRQILRNSFGDKNITRFQNDKILFVNIDDYFYENYNGFPIRRIDIAKILANISTFKPRVIVVDLLMDYPSSYGEDPFLAVALQKHDKIILPSKAIFDEGDRFKEIQYPVEILKKHCSTGYINMTSNNTAVTFISKLKIYPEISKNNDSWPIAVQAVSLFLDKKPWFEKNDIRIGDIRISLDHFDNLYIDFSKLPQYFNLLSEYSGISAQELLDMSILDSFDKEEFSFLIKDKIVILGETSLVSNDWFDTPVGMLFGPEIVGDSINTILKGAPLKPVPTYIEIIILFLIISVLVIFSNTSKKPGHRILFSIFLFLLFIIASILLYIFAGIVLSMIYTLVSGIISNTIIIIYFIFQENQKLNHANDQLIEKQKSLAKAEEKYRLIFENAIEGIFQNLNNGNIISSNQSFANIMGYDASRLMQQDDHLNFFKLFKKNQDKNLFLDMLIKMGQVIGFETQFYKKDKSIIWVGINARTIKNSIGNTVFIEGSLVDITDIRAKEKAEREKKAADVANKSKSIFIASVSHELKTPLNSIIAMSNILNNQVNNEGQRKYIRILKEESNHLLQLINDILDLSKVETGQFNLEYANFNIRDLVENTCEVLKLKAKQKKLELLYDIQSDIPSVLIGDTVRIKQLLYNLITNAIKFTSTGSISLTISINKDIQCEPLRKDFEKQLSVLFSVRDKGIGIEKKCQKNIFNIFTQANSSIIYEYGGTGLGLAICKRLVEMMNGEIWVESEPGKGSCFNFTILFGYIDEPVNIEVSKEPIDNIINTNNKPLNILLVEDHPNNQMVFTMYLEDTQHNIVIAENGKEGIEKYIQGRFDIVFMDIQMPVMNGFEAIKRIRKYEFTNKKPLVPIIVLTAHETKDTFNESKDSGANSHITKPLVKNDLLNAIEKFGQTQKCISL